MWRRNLHNCFIAAVNLALCVGRFTWSDDAHVSQRAFDLTLALHAYLAVNALTYMCRTLRTRVSDSFAALFHTLSVPECLDHLLHLAVLFTVRPISVPTAYSTSVILHLTWLPTFYWVGRACTSYLVRPHHGTDLSETAKTGVIYVLVAGGGFYVAAAIDQSSFLYWSFQQHWANETLAARDVLQNAHLTDRLVLGLLSTLVLFKFLWIARAIKFICKLFQPNTAATTKFGLFARRR